MTIKAKQTAYLKKVLQQLPKLHITQLNILSTELAQGMRSLLAAQTVKCTRPTVVQKQFSEMKRMLCSHQQAEVTQI